MGWLNLVKKLFAQSVRRPACPVAPQARLGLEQLESRLVPYTTSGNAWPAPQLITLSFVPDGTLISTSGGSTVASNLQATFNAKFGSAAAWQNILIKAAQVWAQQTNINFDVVTDDGSSLGSGNYQQGDPAKGDIRIGGYRFGNTNLATAFMPPPVNNYSIAGDIEFNTGQTFNSNGSNYDLFTVAAHEIGHALGLYHSGVVSAEMYSAYGGVKSALTSDDINGIRAIYSGGAARAADAYDAVAANDTEGTASDLSSGLAAGATLTILADVTTTSDLDYYTLIAPADASTLQVSVQSAGLSLLSPFLKVYNANQTVVASASASGSDGLVVTTTISVTPGSRYYILVDGANTTAFGTGKYALNLGINTSAPLASSPNTQKLNGNPLSSGGGQAVQTGQELRVNSFTTDTQQTSAGASRSVAVDEAGDFVVTWASNNQDGNGWGVYAQRYDANGNPVGTEFQVNTTTASDQTSPAVASDNQGNFIIVWQGKDQDGFGWGIFGQRYDAAGNPIGGEFQINTTTAGDQLSPVVDMNGGGAFVVSWASNVQDGSGWGVYAQRYDASGKPVGGEFRVNTTTAGDQLDPTIALSDLGTFMISWTSNVQDGSGKGVYAQLYDASGKSVGREFRVNTTTAGDQLAPSVAMDAGGNSLISWTSNGQDGSGQGVYAQRYDASGKSVGGEFRVNTTTAGDQLDSSATMDTNGNFVIAWSSYNQDGQGWGVYAKQYAASGIQLGDEFLVNSTTTGNQQYATAALNANGRLVVAWSGAGVGDSSGVFAQRYVLGNNLSAEAASDSFDPLGCDDDGCEHDEQEIAASPAGKAEPAPTPAAVDVTSAVRLAQEANALPAALAPVVRVASLDPVQLGRFLSEAQPRTSNVEQPVAAGFQLAAASRQVENLPPQAVRGSTFDAGEATLPGQETEEDQELIVPPDDRGAIPPGSTSASTPREQVESRARLVDACFSNASWLGSEVAAEEGQPGQPGAEPEADGEGSLAPLGMLVGTWLWAAERVPPASAPRDRRRRPGLSDAR